MSSHAQAEGPAVLPTCSRHGGPSRAEDGADREGGGGVSAREHVEAA
jgi:hypothetical protein